MINKLEDRTMQEQVPLERFPIIEKYLESLPKPPYVKLLPFIFSFNHSKMTDSFKDQIHLFRTEFNKNRIYIDKLTQIASHSDIKLYISALECHVNTLAIELRERAEFLTYVSMYGILVQVLLCFSMPSFSSLFAIILPIVVIFLFLFILQKIYQIQRYRYQLDLLSLTQTFQTINEI
jgi:hypothetical protein